MKVVIILIFLSALAKLAWSQDYDIPQTEQSTNSPKSFKYLIPKEDIEFLFPQSPRGDFVWVKVQNPAEYPMEYRNQAGNAVYLIPETAGDFFEPIDSPEAAWELCQLFHWGALVENEDQFQQVVSLYEQLGFSLNGDSDMHSWAKLNEAERTYDIVNQNEGGDFVVTFTAYQDANMMGGKAELSRYSYVISPDGKVVLKEKVIYLEGPFLNWQCLEGSPECMVSQDVRNREELREGVYRMCWRLIPEGINEGFKNDNFLRY